MGSPKMKSVSIGFVFCCIIFANEVGVANAVCNGDEIKRNETGVVQIKGGNAKTIDHSWTLKSELMTSLLIVNMTMVNMHSRNRANVSCDFAIEYVILPDGKQVCHTNKTCGVYISPDMNISNTVAYQSNEYMKVVNDKCATEWVHATTWPPTLCIQARLTTFELELNYHFINLPVPVPSDTTTGNQQTTNTPTTKVNHIPTHQTGTGSPQPQSTFDFLIIIVILLTVVIVAFVTFLIWWQIRRKTRRRKHEVSNENDIYPYAIRRGMPRTEVTQPTNVDRPYDMAGPNNTSQQQQQAANEVGYMVPMTNVGSEATVEQAPGGYLEPVGSAMRVNDSPYSEITNPPTDRARHTSPYEMAGPGNEAVASGSVSSNHADYVPMSPSITSNASDNVKYAQIAPYGIIKQPEERRNRHTLYESPIFTMPTVHEQPSISATTPSSSATPYAAIVATRNPEEGGVLERIHEVEVKYKSVKKKSNLTTSV